MSVSGGIPSGAGLQVFLGGPIQHLRTQDNSREVIAGHREIVTELTHAGFTVLSAHEEEDYGRASDGYPPATVADRDFRWAKSCDMYVAVLPADAAGVPYRTDGTHLEIGWVTALGKRVFVLLEENTSVPYGHLVRGLVDLGHAQALPLSGWRAELIPALLAEACTTNRAADSAGDAAGQGARGASREGSLAWPAR